jgi:spore germination cell wall hydrolase CwlJ-like protein
MITQKSSKLLTGFNRLGRKILQNIQTIGDVFISLLILATLFGLLKYISTDETNARPIEETTTIETSPTQPENAAVEHVPSGPGSTEETWSEQENECLALNVYHESRSDSFAGRIAVADVTLNRVDSNLFPNTICEVVKQANMRTNWKGNVVPVRGMCHFSWFCDGLSDEPMELDAYEEAQIIAEMSLRGGWRGISEGATHYHATYVTPNWINDRGMVPVGRIGAHKFYRWH